MKKALIVSLKFNPGHSSHLTASYKQYEELGYESTYFVAPEFVNFLPANSRVIMYGEAKPSGFDLAMFLFPSEKVFPTIWQLKRNHKCKVIYVFHEPVISFDEYLHAGYSRFQVFLEMLKDLVGCWIVKSADAVILPSMKAYNNFRDCNRYKNKNYHYVPLLFDDENQSEVKFERKYFSYIGTIASDHSFEEYINFVFWAIKNSELLSLNFMIATKSLVEKNSEIESAVASGRLSIFDGKPMTNEEINAHYAESYLVWNAYERMMQSGVLSKAFMFGTPAIVLKRNESEFVKDGEGVVAINNNKSVNEIKDAVSVVVDLFERYSNKSRELFFRDFFYRTHNETLKKIINANQ